MRSHNQIEELKVECAVKWKRLEKEQELVFFLFLLLSSSACEMYDTVEKEKLKYCNLW